MSRCKLRTPWPIHFKLRTVIGIDSLTVCMLYGEISKFDSRVMRLYSSNCRRFFVCRAVNWEPLGQFTSNFAQLLELIVLRSVYSLVKFRFFMPELWDFIHQNVGVFHMSRCKLRTPWPIHFKLRTVIGIDSLTVCVLYGEISKFHSRVMRLYSSNCRRFFVCRAVNWEPLGQFTSNFAQLLELIVLRSVYSLVKFRFFMPELWDFIHQNVGDFSYVAL